MSDNLNNEIKKSLFYDGSVTVTTTGGDITPTLIQPAQTSGLEKYNLDQRDDLNILLYAVTGTVVAGATLTVKYYNRVPNAISDAILLATETKTLAAITVGNYLATEFTNAALELADYFTVECTLKEAVGSDYTVTGNVIVKKKIVDEPATNQTAPVSETRATATYTGAANAGFILYSKLLGTAGNAITYVITTAADDNLAISVTGNAITIALANTTGSKNTATLVKAAIEAKAEANALVAVVLTGTGAGVVATQAVANLTGGLNGTAGYQGQVIFDTYGNEWKMIWTNGAVYYWAPEGFPANNTEYPAYIEGGAVVYKIRATSTSAAAGGYFANTLWTAGYINPDSLRLVSSHIYRSDGLAMPIYGYNSTDFYIAYVYNTGFTTRTINLATYNSRPCVTIIEFKKL
jgi:hypothetical protein